jgi:GrpB-like predicted nucleotidyltransferase (UPF0157 family)
MLCFSTLILIYLHVLTYVNYLKSFINCTMIFYKPEDYQPQAMLIFNDLKPKIETIIPHAFVEHIGSSSIPGMISKGDVDIYVEVSKEQFFLAVNSLADIGLVEKNGTLQNNELRMLVVKDYILDVAVQVVVKGSKYEFFKYFRDALIQNSLFRDEYNKLKIMCIDKCDEEYRKIKSVFIEEMLKTRGA